MSQQQQTQQQEDPIATLTALISSMKDMQEAQQNPYQEGVSKALKKGGEQHTMEALQQGIPAKHIAGQAGLLSRLLDFDLNPEATGQRLDNQLKQQKLESGGGRGAEQSIQRMSDLNKIIDERLPGYQVTQTAEGNFVVHPKAAGILAQLNPDQINTQADNLVNGSVVPSQLPKSYKNQVLIAASQKDPNYNAAQADINFAADKMGTASFQRNFNNLDAFHRNFDKNADYLLTLSDNYIRSVSPLINRGLLAKDLVVTGDAKATRMTQAMYAVALEYARLQNPTLTGQNLSDAARKEARDMLGNFNSGVQVKALLDPVNGSMRVETNNRFDTAKDKLDELKKTNSGSSSSNNKSSFKVIRVREK